MLQKTELPGAPAGFHYTPRGTKASRLAARLGSRTFDYPALRDAQSIESIVRSRDGHLFQGFNANPLRGRIMQSLARATGCSVFVETGSGKAATTLAAHSFLKLPVWSCEKSLANYLLCRCLVAGLSGVEIHHSDSPQFLRKSIERLARNASHVPFFFLDAHGGFDGTGATGDSCPLLDEIEIVHTAPRFLAVIDDVQLPGFPGGTYGDTFLDLKFMTPTLLAQGTKSCWIPNYSTVTDIGWPSGYCVFGHGIDLESILGAPEFPLNLLQKRMLE